MTLEQIRAALPTHIMLTPGVHRWHYLDEFWHWHLNKFTNIQTYEGEQIGEIIEADGTLIARRPIPPHILDNQAFHLLLDKGFESRDHFADKAENLGIVRKLGGLDNYRAQTKAGRLYDKWLLEQIESGG